MSELYPPSIQSKLNIHLWWLTAALIAINVGLFALEVINGMDISHPSTADAIRWGADYAPLTYLAEPIRIFSSMFFHFGLIHLALNMWALYIFGNIAEQLFGRFFFLGLYLLAGLMGSLFSGAVSIYDTFQLLQLQQIDPDLLPRVSAGASGAVMGIGAALTVLSLFPVLPQQRFILDKKTLVFIMILNLGMGFSLQGINNAAHIGGMVMGVVLTCFWYLGQRLNKVFLINNIALLLGALACYLLYVYCMQQATLLAPVWQQMLQAMQAHIQN